MAFLMWPSVQAMNLSCVNRSSSLTSLATRAFSPFLSFSLSFRSPKLPFAALCGNPSEPTLRVISQQNLSIAGVTYSSQHHCHNATYVAILVIHFLFFLYSVFPLLPHVQFLLLARLVFLWSQTHLARRRIEV